MLHRIPWTHHPYACRSRVIAAFLIASVPLPIYAAGPSSCRLTDPELVCRLRSVLAFLDVTAWVLGGLLLLATFIAIRAYRNKPGKITPKDVSIDDR